MTNCAVGFVSIATKFNIELASWNAESVTKERILMKIKLVFYCFSIVNELWVLHATIFENILSD